MTALRVVGWLAGAPDHAQQYSCHICNTQHTEPSRMQILGCDEPTETAIASKKDRPSSRGPNRQLHVGPLGIRTWRCPRAWTEEPIAIRGWQAFSWWETGQLAALFAPGPIPAKAIEAVDIVRTTYTTAHNAYLDRRTPNPDGRRNG